MRVSEVELLTSILRAIAAYPFGLTVIAVATRLLQYAV